MKNQCEACNKYFHTTLGRDKEAEAVEMIIEAIRPLGITFSTAIDLMGAVQERLKEMSTFLTLGQE